MVIGGATPALVAGFGAVLGHVFPVWLKFKGGKGVATYIGVLLAVSWPVALGFAVVWVAVAALTRYSSLAGLIASAATPVLLWFSSAATPRCCSPADRAGLGHAPRQHCAADRRHRAQDRKQEQPRLTRHTKGVIRPDAWRATADYAGDLLRWVLRKHKAIFGASAPSEWADLQEASFQPAL